MTIARIISIGVVTMFALAIGIATFDAAYAAGPCCSVRNGVWIVNKTGKPASPAQIRTMEQSQTRKSIGGNSPEHSNAPAAPSGGHK
jgi:hypothetical protein